MQTTTIPGADRKVGQVVSNGSRAGRRRLLAFPTSDFLHELNSFLSEGQDGTKADPTLVLSGSDWNKDLPHPQQPFFLRNATDPELLVTTKETS